ncbi:hypothetical protein M752DRAFT_136290 [Aspergillus phoenicis ATCC 13157]|uniref:Uncharacterized protein n=1 Tax=Aspergillus phoenicis ATCC 13157 TaxID=1353007 RepID=A0A370PPU6_ASPPH|nr:hypothetical protein M752DRAFT_136290 [Aspergillus phoenicis ATCC 13157]
MTKYRITNTKRDRFGQIIPAVISNSELVDRSIPFQLPITIAIWCPEKNNMLKQRMIDRLNDIHIRQFNSRTLAYIGKTKAHHPTHSRAWALNTEEK